VCPAPTCPDFSPATTRSGAGNTDEKVGVTRRQGERSTHERPKVSSHVTPRDGPDCSGKRFVAAAETLLLRVREPLRSAPNSGPTGALHSIDLTIPKLGHCCTGRTSSQCSQPPCRWLFARRADIVARPAVQRARFERVTSIWGTRDELFRAGTETNATRALDANRQAVPLSAAARAVGSR
jgi:hypothetical protein